MEKGPEQGQGRAAFFIRTSSESSSADLTGDMKKPSVLSRQLFSQIRGAAQMNKVSCWIILCQFCLSWASGPKIRTVCKNVSDVKSSACAITIVCAIALCLQIQGSKQALSPEYYQSQNTQAKRARIHNLGNNCIFCLQAVFYSVLQKQQARH